MAIYACIIIVQRKNSNTIRFSEIRTYINKDILDDIKLILNGLKNAGLKRAIIVDLTNPNLGIPVVRAIVPDSKLLKSRNYLWGPNHLWVEEQKNIL